MRLVSCIWQLCACVCLSVCVCMCVCTLKRTCWWVTLLYLGFQKYSAQLILHPFPDWHMHTNTLTIVAQSKRVTYQSCVLALCCVRIIWKCFRQRWLLGAGRSDSFRNSPLQYFHCLFVVSVFLPLRPVRRERRTSREAADYFTQGLTGGRDRTSSPTWKIMNWAFLIELGGGVWLSHCASSAPLLSFFTLFPHLFSQRFPVAAASSWGLGFVAVQNHKDVWNKRLLSRRVQGERKPSLVQKKEGQKQKGKLQIKRWLGVHSVG